MEDKQGTKTCPCSEMSDTELSLGTEEEEKTFLILC